MLSCSIAVSLAIYYLGSGVLYQNGEYDLVFSFFDCVFGFVAVGFMIGTLEEMQRKPEHTQISVVEFKNFKELEEIKIDDSENLEVKKTANFKFLAFMAMFSAYLGMILTSWGSNQYTWLRFLTNITQSLGLFTFYIWTLLVPIVLPGSEVPVSQHN